GGSTVWSSIADYRPPPLEVLRNPWIQWTVLLPRDITGPRYEGIHRWGPAALQALGVTDALTHMEWFARPDGSVAVSEVAAPPPPTTWARGTRWCATPTPRWSRTRCAGSSTASASSWPRPEGRSDEHRHALPRLPGGDGLLHPGAGRGGGPGHRGGRPAAARA